MREGMMVMWRGVLVSAVMVGLCSCSSEPPKGFARAEGDLAYTKVNLWSASGRKILSPNYHQGTRLPAGTRVRITGRQANGLTFMTGGGDVYSVILLPKVTPITLDELVSRWFSREDVFAPGQAAELFTPEELDNIEKGTLATGMRKDAVLMAYGYPPAGRTPDLGVDTWVYLSSARGRQIMELKFKENRLLSVDGKIGPQTVRVYAVSDPAGAVIECDGAFVGKAPCVMTFVVDPDQRSKLRVIRATPAKPDVPRMGVACGMPVGGPVFGEYITVSEVLPLSMAHKMGVKRGDKIVSIAGAAIRSERECVEVVKNLGFNRELTMVVRRGELEVKLKGKTEEIDGGEFAVQERALTMEQLTELDQKMLVFDMREKKVAPSAAASPVKPGAGIAASAGESLQAGVSNVGAGAAVVLSPEPMIDAVGTGFVVAPGGYVLTCANLVTGARVILVRTAKGEEFGAEVVKTDVGNDWCILRVAQMEKPVMPWGDRKSTEKGGKLFCLGFAVDKATGKTSPIPVVRTGTVLDSNGLDGDSRHIQVAMALGEGYSGSCVLDAQGRLAALVSDKLNNLIQSVAPRGTVMAGTVFAQKAEVIAALLPAEVRVEPPAAATTVTTLTAEGIRQQRAESVVMIRVRR